MITTPTVLVLGAGASQPYGYPLGQELVNKIVLDAAGSVSKLYKDLRQLNISEAFIKILRNDLRVSARQSVDAFLESRSDLVDIGRLAIASELLGYEDADKIYATNDWYQYLFNRMCDPNQFESFGASKVSIITFNYDRSLEFCLFTALRKSFQKSFAECVENFERIRIIHVHGQIGRSPTDEDNWQYGLSKVPDIVRNSAQQIKIIHEANDDTEEFRDARKRLRGAEVICFLGFGYHPINLGRLLKGIDNLTRKTILPCGCGLTDRERTAIQRLVPNCRFQWRAGDHKCLEFLRETGASLG